MVKDTNSQKSLLVVSILRSLIGVKVLIRRFKPKGQFQDYLFRAGRTFNGPVGRQKVGRLGGGFEWPNGGETAERGGTTLGAAEPPGTKRTNIKHASDSHNSTRTGPPRHVRRKRHTLDTGN